MIETQSSILIYNIITRADMPFNIKPKPLFLCWVELLFMQEVEIEEQSQDAEYEVEIH